MPKVTELNQVGRPGPGVSDLWGSEPEGSEPGWHNRSCYRCSKLPPTLSPVFSDLGLARDLHHQREVADPHSPEAVPPDDLQRCRRPAAALTSAGIRSQHCRLAAHIGFSDATTATRRETDGQCDFREPRGLPGAMPHSQSSCGGGGGSGCPATSPAPR